MEHVLNGKPVWILTWLLMVMPLFFVAGGFANTLIHDRWRAKGQSYGEFLGLRARRLMTPLVPLIVVTLLAGLIGGLISPSVQHIIGDQIGNVLWFLAVYLICVALTPLLVSAHDRLGS